MGTAQLARKNEHLLQKSKISKMFISLKYTLYRPLSMQISTFSKICREVLVIHHIQFRFAIYRIIKQKKNLFATREIQMIIQLTGNTSPWSLTEHVLFVCEANDQLVPGSWWDSKPLFDQFHNRQRTCDLW